MLILASQSPRRQEILRNAGLAFDVRVSGIEEVPEPGEKPADYVLRLACDKAKAVSAGETDYVLAADTIVLLGDAILEKPQSVDEARSMLRRLSGREHEVMTGVCLRRGEASWPHVERTRVVFNKMSEEEIDAYARSGEPMDKAGAYAIQGLASKFISRVEGCYLNVVGLPMAEVYRLLKQAGYNFEVG